MQSDATESTKLFEFLAWFELHKKRIYAVGTTIIGLIVCIQVYVWYRDNQEAEASKALLALKALPANAEDTGLASASDFLRVASTHASTRAGERALLLAAANLFSEGKYAEAQAQYEKFQQNYGGSELIPVAALGIAASLDAQDKVDAALAAYQGVIAKYPADAVASRAKLATALIYESKSQFEQAFKVYDEMAKQVTASSSTSDADNRRERLLQQHPNLAALIAPPAAPTNLPSATVTVPVPPPAGAPPAAKK